MLSTTVRCPRSAPWSFSSTRLNLASTRSSPSPSTCARMTRSRSSWAPPSTGATGEGAARCNPGVFSTLCRPAAWRARLQSQGKGLGRHSGGATDLPLAAELRVQHPERNGQEAQQHNPSGSGSGGGHGGHRHQGALLLDAMRL